MKKYICTICGYVYDEVLGDPDGGIVPGTKWEDIPVNWSCPTCGAAKSDFEENKEKTSSGTASRSAVEDDDDKMRELSFGELSALCANLSKGCEKQYRPHEAELFNQLAEFYYKKRESVNEKKLNDLLLLIEQDLSTHYPRANEAAASFSDRGGLRALVWGEKVSKILKSLLSRCEKQSDTLLKGSGIYVCGICGFVYIGNELPIVCPVCKVTNKKISEITREGK